LLLGYIYISSHISANYLQNTLLYSSINCDAVSLVFNCRLFWSICSIAAISVSLRSFGRIKIARRVLIIIIIIWIVLLTHTLIFYHIKNNIKLQNKRHQQVLIMLFVEMMVFPSYLWSLCIFIMSWQFTFINHSIVLLSNNLFSI
jgi:hypothetical protein